MTEPGPISLHLLRHADAGDPDKWQGDDAARPLSEKGVGQAERLGRHLARVGFETDAIVTSPKLRALQTAEIVGRALGRQVSVDERLAGSLDPRRVAAILGDAGHPAKPVLVGHDPDFSELLADLAGATRLSLKKGAMARVDLRAGIHSGEGLLRWLLPPDLIPGDGDAGRQSKTPSVRRKRASPARPVGGGRSAPRPG